MVWLLSRDEAADVKNVDPALSASITFQVKGFVLVFCEPSSSERAFSSFFDAGGLSHAPIELPCFQSSSKVLWNRDAMKLCAIFQSYSECFVSLDQHTDEHGLSWCMLYGTSVNAASHIIPRSIKICLKANVDKHFQQIYLICTI